MLRCKLQFVHAVSPLDIGNADAVISVSTYTAQWGPPQEPGALRPVTLAVFSAESRNPNWAEGGLHYPLLI